MRNPTPIAAAAALALIGALADAPAASAHATFENASPVTAKSHKAVLRVPHGCDGQATHTVRVTLPEGIVGVKPMPKPNWKLTTAEGDYARPYTLWGKPVSKGVKEIVWSNGELADAHFDEFTFQMVVAADAGATELPVPVVQECATGTVGWTEIAAPGQDPHALKHPTPVLKVQMAQAANPHAGHAMPPAAAPAPAKSYKAGALVIENVWTRATPGGARVGGGFLTIRNSGTEPDRLIGFETPAAGHGEVHEMAMADGVMKMREVKSIEIKPGDTVALKPGGYHLMFMALKNPIAQGAPVAGTLVFEKAGRVAVEFSVAPIGASAPPAGEHKH